MNINGLVFPMVSCWLADIPAIDLMVQGDSFDDAFNQVQAVFEEELPKVEAEFFWINQDQYFQFNSRNQDRSSTK